MSRMLEEVELEKSVRRLRELFHGSVEIEKAVLLMQRHANDFQRVAKCIALMAEDTDVVEEDDGVLNDPVIKNVAKKLRSEDQQMARGRNQVNDGEDVENLGERLRVLPLTMENMRKFDRAQELQIPSVVHQFSCGSCDRDWWRRVPQRKRVSRCHRCKKKYDPVPPDKMWGWAEFHCQNCSRFFMGFGRMDGCSPCYICHWAVFPTQILPPRKNRIPGPLKRNQHSCLAEDCFNRMEPHVAGTECVHPCSRQKNRKPRVVFPSPAHISSGSTINTCLSQGSLLESIHQLILDDIEEESDLSSCSS